MLLGVEVFVPRSARASQIVDIIFWLCSYAISIILDWESVLNLIIAMRFGFVDKAVGPGQISGGMGGKPQLPSSGSGAGVISFPSPDMALLLPKFNYKKEIQQRKSLCVRERCPKQRESLYMQKNLKIKGQVSRNKVSERKRRFVYVGELKRKIINSQEVGDCLAKLDMKKDCFHYQEQ